MLNWLHKHKFHLLFIAFSLCIGFCIGKFTSVPYFEVEKKWNILTLLQVFCTLFIGIYVAGKIQKNKTEKDLLIKRIDSILEFVDECYTSVSDGEIEYSEAASRMKRASQMVTNIQQAISTLNLPNHSNEFVEILGLVREIRDLTTNTPNNLQKQVKGSNLPIEVQDGIVTLANERVNVVSMKYDSLKHKLLMLQLSLNQS